MCNLAPPNSSGNSQDALRVGRGSHWNLPYFLGISLLAFTPSVKRLSRSQLAQGIPGTHIPWECIQFDLDRPRIIWAIWPILTFSARKAVFGIQDPGGCEPSPHPHISGIQGSLRDILGYHRDEGVGFMSNHLPLSLLNPIRL